MQLVSVIAPVYRNSGTLLELHRRISAALENSLWRVEILFVDDACPESSGELLTQIAAGDPRVRLIRHALNLGQQQALLDGIAAARGDAIVLLDADCQDPPEAIPKLLTALETGQWSAVFAGRRGEYQNRLRMITSRVYRGILTRLAGLPRDAGIFVAFTRGTADRILAFRVRRPYLTVMIGAAGGRFLSIPVERQRRTVGSSAYRGGMRFRAAARAISLAFGLSLPGWMNRRGQLPMTTPLMTSTPPTTPGFSEDRLVRLSQIEDSHFWFRGRRKLVQLLLKNGGVQPPQRVLDIGAGAGAISLMLSRMGYRVTSADFLPGLLRRIATEDPQIRCVQCSLQDLPFQPGTFDCILVLDVLEHIDDDDRVLPEIVSLLVPGGRLLLTVPAFPFLWSYRDVAAGHRRRYRRAGLLHMIARSDLRVDYLNYYQCFLFPAIALSRFFGRRNENWRDAEDLPSGMVNRVLSAITSLEVAVASKCLLPFGASLVVAATRIGATQTS